jgi:hypothetical protein
MKYIRVTQVFGHFAPVGVKQSQIASASERGTDVHDLCFRKARGIHVTKPRSEYMKSLWPYYQSFEKWFDLMVVKVHSVEPEFKHWAYGYLGHPDILATIRDNNGLVVIDLKTPIKARRIWAGQCAAYMQAAVANSWPVIKSASLQLDPLGRMAKMTWYDYQARDFNMFLSLLHGYRYFFMEEKHE